MEEITKADIDFSCDESTVRLIKKVFSALSQNSVNALILFYKCRRRVGDDQKTAFYKTVETFDETMVKIK